jgi:hypothetical protein
MKKRILALFLVLTAAVLAFAQEPLETAVRQKDWTALAAQFDDDTHLQLSAYFQECQEVGFSLLRPNNLMYFARFRDVAEIGELAFERENGRYRRLALKRTIKPLYFIRSFLRYAVVDRRLRMGDAEIHFRKGFIYRGMPMGNVFLFSGEWEFRIRPDSNEERLTLQTLERSDTLVKEARGGVFVLNSPEELLEGLSEPEPAMAPDDEEVLTLYKSLQERWGMPVSFFDELWYFPFAPGFNAALFHRKPGKSYFRYIFNSSNSPDTSLVLLPENKFYLSYNAVKGLKFTQAGVDELENLQLNLFINPYAGFLSATSVLNFKEPSSVKTVSLDPGLVVKGYGRSLQHELQLFHRDDTYYLLGEGLNKFSFYYAGAIDSSTGGGDLAKFDLRGRSAKNIDQYYILDRDQNFYPNPGQHFFKSRLKISLPAPLLCLASGSLRSQRKLGEHTEFTFESPGSKGVSVVCGGFEKLLTVPAALPVQVFGNPKLRLKESFSAEAIQGYVDFLVEKFGPLEVPEINLLIRRWQDYGGLSNQGFIVFNLMETNFIDDDVSMLRRLRSDSPVVFSDVNRDNLVHELAHQWWGGLVSWKTYQDQWLTEGLAQFATLLYLENTVGGNSFRRIVAGSKRWVFRKNDAGPVIYGRRIANLSEDLQAFQSVVYNKAALIFLMLKEMLGEEELLQRLRQVLTEFKYQSLVSARFIQQVSQGDARLQKFFNGWVYSRKLPKVRYQVAISGPSAEITFTQEDSDFVFPVAIRVASGEGKYTRTLIVEEKVQKFKIFENAPILSIQVDSLVSPIDLQE